jgi:type II secretory pathway component PulJ
MSSFVDGGAIERRQSLDPNIGRRHLAPRQKNNMVTISTAQFQQQQQIISALAQQQEEFKRMIQVLQEQQQQLVNLPMQFGQSHFGSDESAQVMLVGLYFQYDMYSIIYIKYLCL